MAETVAQDNDIFWMQKALQQAVDAFERGEFPVGCVISDGNTILAQGLREGTAGGGKNEVDHAEVVALRQLYADEQGADSACDHSGLTIYSTLEPCLMCMGAILISGIGRLVYAYEDAMGGGTRISRTEMSPLYRHNKLVITPYVMRKESLGLMKQFFQSPDNTYWVDSLLANYTLCQIVLA